MFRRRIKCAVLIDFDNIVGVDHVSLHFAQSISNWLAWIEDGAFEGGGGAPRRRRIVARRVYWNSQGAVWRGSFEAHGFETLVSRSQVRGKKSAADMMIALDALQLSYEAPTIEEYVVLTTDTDFVPLLAKLAERGRRTVAAANPENKSFEVYADCADLVISTHALRGACDYARPETLWTRLRSLLAAAPAALLGALTALTAPLRRLGDLLASWSGRAPRPRRRSASEAAMREAAHILAQVGARTPGLPMSRQTVLRALSAELETFETKGPNAYLGAGDYVALLRALAALRADLRLHEYANGGAAVSAPAATPQAEFAQ